MSAINSPTASSEVITTVTVDPMKAKGEPCRFNQPVVAAQLMMAGAVIERKPATTPIPIARRKTTFNSPTEKLRFAAESDVIVEVEKIEPGLHVFAVGVELLHPPGEHFESFDVAIGPALGKVGAPLLDFPRGALMRSVFLDPLKNLPIAFASGKLGFQRFGGDAGETKPVIIGGIVVFKFSGRACDLGPSFIEDAGKDDITAETHSRATRRTLRKIRRVICGATHPGSLSRHALIAHPVSEEQGA